MARPREFNEDDAVTAAMNVFWKNGYGDASISLLLDGMGMTKGSFYKAFTDKKSLFLTAMTRYEVEQVGPAVALLRNPAIADGHARITQLFTGIAGAVRGGDVRGCMLCSAAAGPSFEDRDIASVVGGLLDQMRAAFEDAARAGQPGTDRADQLARVLLTQYVGLRILARAHTPADELDRNIAAVLSLLPVDTI